MSASVTPSDPTGYTVSDLVGLALRQVGVGAQGTTPNSTDLSDGLMHLNLMLAQWQRRRWLVPTLVDIATVSSGVGHYTVGDGENFDTKGGRPDQIEAAYVRLLQGGAIPVGPGDFDSADFATTDFNVESGGLDQSATTIDFPLQIIASREDYSTIGLKNLRTWPVAAYYSPDYPTGTLYVWPIPAVGQFEIHIVCKQVLSGQLALTDQINLPPEYQDAIMWNLAVRAAPSYGEQADPVVVTMAKSALQTIRTANLQVPSLSLPSALAPIGRRNGFWLFQTGDTV